MSEAAPEWRPFPAQVPFLATEAREALYGGAAGGGKTDALVVGALAHVHHARFTAIIFRRTFPELEGKVIPVSKEWYPASGGVYNGSKHSWMFPSGARVMFAHLQHEDDVLQYQGHEFQYIGFDELTHFTEKQYVYLLSRLRTTSGIPLEVRSGSNPGGPGHEWVFKRWAPWLDRNGEIPGPRAAPGEVLRFDNTKNGEVWSETGRFSRVFFPAYAKDNPYLNDDYVHNLMGQDAVTRAQLIDGDWLIKPAAGLLFKRGWFDSVAIAPAQAQRVRYWDRAATKDGDYTVGLKLAKDTAGHLFIEHVERLRGTPREVEAAILRIAGQDGHAVVVGIEQDPGQAGVFEAQYYARALSGFNVKLQRPTGDKVTRAQPVSAQAEAGNVSLVKGPWVDKLLAELEAFPDGDHDDQVDALSGAFSVLQGSAYVANLVRAMKAGR
jgi:predicted phage terminase large subunit-like protein